MTRPGNTPLRQSIDTSSSVLCTAAGIALRDDIIENNNFGDTPQLLQREREP
ncbi:MAG: hypothetical protein U0892_18825 [Pirellulales bacterium]